MQRWIAVCLGSVLLHLAVLNWAGGYIHMPTFPPPTPPIIKVALQHAPTPIPVIVPLQRPETPKVVKKSAKPRPPRPIADRAAPPPEPNSFSTIDTATEVASAPIETPPSPPPVALAPAPEVIIPPPAAVEPQPQAAIPLPEPTPKQTRFRVNLPPPAELKYKVQALRDGQNAYGSSSMRWQHQDGHYSLKGETTGLLFFTLLSFTSEGETDAFGLAPVIYSEKRFRKSATNTHFNRERDTISFSASTNTYPRSGGSQDRASMLWQLAGIGRGDSEKFLRGANIDMFVAGVRDAEIWRFEVIGLEQIKLDGTDTMTWHLARAPRPGSYEHKLDIWLDPRQEWYPVRLRDSENNGDYIDMTLSKLTPLAPDNNN